MASRCATADGRSGAVMPAGLSTSDFYYILPELVLTAGALLLLVADVMLPRGEQAADVGRGRRACRDGRLARAVPVRARRGLARSDRRRPVRPVLQGHLPRRRDSHGADVAALPRDRGRQPRRVLLPDSVRDARHDDHGGRHRSDHAVHRPRDDGGVVLHPGRLHQAESAVERSGGEVFPPRRVFARHPAVRDVAAVRAVGYDQPAHDGFGVRGPGARSAAGARRDPDRRRHGLQDCRRAVPHVGARRLRGCADAGHGIPLGRIESGVVCDAAADLPRRTALDEHRLASAVRGAGDRHDDGREISRR